MDVDTPFNPFDSSMAADPYPAYDALLAQGPIVRNDAMGGLLLVGGYDETSAVLRNHDAFSSGGLVGGGSGMGQSMVFADPPDHTRLRGVVARAFTPRSIAALEPRIREITEGLVAGLAPGTDYDVVDELAVPLPVTVIAEMLGIDPARRADFKRWSDAIVGMGMMGPGPGGSAEFREYFEEAVRERRTRPRDDLISRLVQANEDDVLTADELSAAVVLLLVAGNETTTNLVSLAALNLARHPDQRRRLVDDPGMIPNGIEEVLRYDSPVHVIPPRRVLRDVDLAGSAVPKGSAVVTLLGAANRDPRRWPSPATFDVGRPDAANNVAFGAGIHYCLGAPLARLEGRIALEALLRKAPDFQIREPDIEFHPSLFLRSIKRLRIAA